MTLSAPGGSIPVQFSPSSSASSAISGGLGGFTIGGINTGTQGAVPPVIFLAAAALLLVVLLRRR